MSLSINEKKAIKLLFKNYRRMDHNFISRLTSYGFEVQRASKHVKLFYHGKLFICPSSGSDYRGGRNLASAICNAVSSDLPGRQTQRD